MLPMMLDLVRLRLALVGVGNAALRRLERLDAAGASALTVYAPGSNRALAAQAGSRLVGRSPTDDELAAAQIVFVAGLAAADAAEIAARARAAGTIVHVEDASGLSDAQLPAVLHRGDLTIAISTNGRSPGLAVEMKRALGQIIGPEWAARLIEVAAQRRRWRHAGLTPPTVARRTVTWLSAHGWLTSIAASESNWSPDAAANDEALRRVRRG